MNLWSRLLLHLRRARLRQRFSKEQEALQKAFCNRLLAGSTPEQQWHDVQWIAEPLLHVVPDTDQIPLALVGLAALFTNNSSETMQTMTGTAVFYFENNTWQTSGKLLPMTPSETLRELDHQAMVS